MRVAVVGAGVIGLATAYSLVRQGHSVELIEGRDDVALETSFAKLESDLQALTQQLGSTQDHNQQQRPPATGGDGQQLAKF